MNKRKVIENIFILLLTVILLTVITPNYVNADTPREIDPSDWKPSDLNPGDVQEITDSAKIIVSFIRYIGIAASIIAIMILGIRFMLGSIEERAEYKKSMKEFLIGVLIFFALSQVLALIIDVASSFK